MAAPKGNKFALGNNGGRPTVYGEEILKKAQAYLDSFKDPKVLEEEVIPSVEGLSEAIDIARSTIYKWKEEEGKEKFSDIFEKILNLQAKFLISYGLSGKYAPTITKVILTKHGYREGLDQTTNDKDLPVPILGNAIQPNNGN